MDTNKNHVSSYLHLFKLSDKYLIIVTVDLIMFDPNLTIYSLA